MATMSMNSTPNPSRRRAATLARGVIAGLAAGALASAPALAQSTSQYPVYGDTTQPAVPVGAAPQAPAYPTAPAYPAAPTTPAPAAPTYPAVPSYPAPQTPASPSVPAYPQAPSQPVPAYPDDASTPRYSDQQSGPRSYPDQNPYAPRSAAPAHPADACIASHTTDGTYGSDDLIGAAAGIFGTGAHGLADIIQSILHKQGRPDGYIVGREAGGAFIVGLRYGSGRLCGQAVGQGVPPMPVYWTGPSIGFDAGANAGQTFVLVYNLTATDDLYHRFGAGEGQAYVIGGFNVSYLRRGRVVLIPVRLGVGLRLGVNGGYMKFSHKQKWLPF